MANDVLDFIKGAKRCFDGATGTMLMRLGMKVGECPEMVDEAIMEQVHNAYITAGAQFITTNTFGGSRPKLAKFGLGDRVTEINRRNAAIAKRTATGRGVYVAGDIGPTGEFIQPYGDFTKGQFEEVFSEQAKALAEGGADLIIIETMSAIEELTAAIRAVKSSTTLPVIACMTFDKTPNGYRTMMGITPQQAVGAMHESGADVVGTNCTLTPPEIVDLAKELRSLTERPILAQPNAGQPHLVDGKTTYAPIPNLEESLRQIIQAGTDIVGGCCGTDPEYIRLLRSLIDEANTRT